MWRVAFFVPCSAQSYCWQRRIQGGASLGAGSVGVGIRVAKLSQFAMMSFIPCGDGEIGDSD